MQQRKGQLSRADLLEMLAKADQASSEIIAGELGLSSDFTQVSGESGSSDPQDLVSDVNAAELLLTAQDDQQPEFNEQAMSRKPFWLCVERELQEDIELPPPEPVANQTLVWPCQPKRPAAWLPLLPLKALLPRLIARIAGQRKRRELDIDAMVKAMGKGHYLTELPRRLQHSLGQNLYFIDDRQVHLMPFWRDHYLVRRSLKALLPEQSGMTLMLPDGMDQLTAVPAPGSTVLILSDLGTLSQQKTGIVSVWLDILRQLQRRHCKAIVLLPCPLIECDVRFQPLITAISWSKGQELIPLMSVQKRQVKHLLCLLSPALRLEPGLIRQMRLYHNLHHPNDIMQPPIEALLWQHAALSERHSTAASWYSDARQEFLKRFSKLDNDIKQGVIPIIRLWRNGVPLQVWFEEVIDLLAVDDGAEQLVGADARAAVAYFQGIEAQQRYQPEQLSTDDQDWLQRVLQRLPETGWSNHEFGACFQRLKYALSDGLDLEHIDPSQLPVTNRQPRQVELCQYGQSLRLLQFNPKRDRPAGFSPLCLFTLRYPYVQLQQDGKRVAEFRLGGDDDVSLVGLDNFELISDCEHLTFERWYRPDDCERVGQDQFGLYLDLLLPQAEELTFAEQEKLKQRFRYIPPQTFMMGSPESEPGRYDRETQHQITLTKGYWIADTATTQALWQAITGENPSQFTAENKPVEQVSWDDVQVFIKKLQSHFPMLELALPTETEWECACRAGTTTAFWFGGKDDLNLGRVNYSGKWDEWNSDGETKEVKSLPANPWGLYEMHGNVDEWVQDNWSEKLPATPVSDPLNAGEPEVARRVVRGGSWSNDGRFCRSACRPGYAPGGRYYDLGFRLVFRSYQSGGATSTG